MATLTVSEGLLYFYGVAERGITLRTRGLMATLELADTGSFIIPSGAYKPGEVIKLSGNLAGGQTLNSGPGYYSGTSYVRLWYEGTLKFLAKNAIAPGNSPKPVAVRTPFKFNGSLKAYQANNSAGGGGPAVFDVKLTGTGKATAELGASYDLGGGIFGRDVRAWLYYF